MRRATKGRRRAISGAPAAGESRQMELAFFDVATSLAPITDFDVARVAVTHGSESS